ncbi:MAG: peptide chain release factor N(5)-glutamine methyltransferase [Firmicutes bacterium]|nr:peptide chain release factor N(5)-glutamine methyltransferase [Bacillota bacterium]
MPTPVELYRRGRKILDNTGYCEGETDTRVLLLHALRITREQYYISGNEMEVSPEKVELFENYLRKRIARMPVAYITGRKEFMGIEFAVNPSVLIPRPATETLVNAGLGILEKLPSPLPLAADIGCGSGCIALSLAFYNPVVRVAAVDISPDALKTAVSNAEAVEAAHPGRFILNRVTFMNGDLFGSFPEDEAGAFDLILSNPPYVTEAEWEDLMSGVKLYEPKTALCPPMDAEEFYAKIAREALVFLKKDGWLLVEIGAYQGEMIKMVFNSAGFEDVFMLQDLEGFDRVVGGRKP